MKLPFAALIKFSLVTLTVGANLHGVVDTLIQGINPTTIYYDLTECGNSDEGLLQRGVDVPRLVITGEDGLVVAPNSFELGNSQALFIIFIGSQIQMDDYNKRLPYLKDALNRWYRIDILFVVNETVDSKQNWKWLFDWCWSKGFYNILLTSAKQAGVLLKLSKFPRIHAKKTTIESYLNHRNKWENFKGYPIRVGIAHYPPNSIIYNQFPDGGEPSFSGIQFHLIKLFAELHNATFVPVGAPSRSACSNSIKSGEVDICAALVEYEVTQEFTIAREIIDIRLIVPFAPPLEIYKYVLLPFDWYIWIALIFLVGFAGIALSLLNWRQVGAFDMSASLLMAFSDLLYISNNLPRSPSKVKYLVYAIMLFAGFIVTNLYLAKLSSFVTSTVYQEEIESVEDLIERNITILWPNTTLRYMVFGIPDELWDQSEFVDEKTFLLKRDNLTPNYAYPCGLTRCEYLLYRQRRMSRPLMRLALTSHGKIFASHVVKTGWPLKEIFDQHILKVQSMGLFEGIRRRIEKEMFDKGLLKTNWDQDEGNLKPFTLRDIQSSIMILITGHTLAFLTFLVEILYHYLQTRN